MVLGAGENNIFLVFCLTGEKEISAFLVENNNKGISFSNPHPKMGLNAIPIRDVIFNNCRVPISNMIGKKGEGFKIAMNVLEAERLNIGISILFMYFINYNS